jgi:hypothetical protein
MATFEIKISDLHWLPKNEPDDGMDLCLHGCASVKINDEVLSDKESGDWAVSATALYLLRTLKSDYQPDDFSSQLLPHCGHFIIAEDDKPVEIWGCPNGVDWTIKHIDGGVVKLISMKGSEALISEEDYQAIVFAFADKVEQFYKDSRPRIIPDDEFDKKGYNAFWTEWRKLRNKFSSNG